MSQKRRRTKPVKKRGRLPRIVYTWSYGRWKHYCRLSCGHRRFMPKSSERGNGLKCLKDCVHPEDPIVVGGQADLLEDRVIRVTVLSGPTEFGFYDVEDGDEQLYMVLGYQLKSVRIS